MYADLMLDATELERLSQLPHGRPPVRFLALVVRGIGNSGEHGEKLAKHVAELESACGAALAAYFPDAARAPARVDFRAFDWQKDVHTQLSEVEQSLEAVTLPNVEYIREVLPFRSTAIALV